MKNLPLPESQLQEVLYELINRFTIDRRSMMLSANIWNLPARILDLRNHGVSIESNICTGTNKYGREIEYVTYSLINKAEARDIYLRLKENQSKRPEDED